MTDLPAIDLDREWSRFPMTYGGLTASGAQQLRRLFQLEARRIVAEAEERREAMREARFKAALEIVGRLEGPARLQGEADAIFEVARRGRPSPPATTRTNPSHGDEKPQPADD